MSNTPKWHRELEIFSRIKPLIMLEGNILDSYQFPYEGSVPKGSILRLSDYLHYFIRTWATGALCSMTAAVGSIIPARAATLRDFPS